MKIDMYAHICPQKFLDYFSKHVLDCKKLVGIDKLATSPAIWDVEKRLEVMNRFEDYVQVLVPTQPTTEAFCTPENALQVARVYNDTLAEIVGRHPDKFVGAVAYLPLNNIEAALREIDRTIGELGFKGILMNTPIIQLKKPGDPTHGYDYDTMKPIDWPEFMPIYERMSKHNLPIWIHPKGEGGLPVYRGEERAKYGLSPTIFGWPVETTMAMSRLVGSGIMAKYPNLRFITHHCGGGMIPMLAARFDTQIESLGKAGIKWGDGVGEDPFLSKRPTDYFRMFYADTVVNGYVPGLMCGHAFFGVEHLLFGTDAAFGPENGERYIRETIEAIEKMDISPADKEKIFEGNAKRILRLNLKR